MVSNRIKVNNGDLLASQRWMFMARIRNRGRTSFFSPTYCKTNPFKVYNLVVFGMLTKLYNHDHCLILKHFHLPKKKLYISSHISRRYWQLQLLWLNCLFHPLILSVSVLYFLGALLLGASIYTIVSSWWVDLFILIKCPFFSL